jgi:hypothetical protein
VDPLAGLKSAGWNVQSAVTSSPLGPDIRRRYPWLPREHVSFVESAEVIASPDEKVWVLTARDFSAGSDSAFAWNEWELQSLGAASSDVERKQIEAFWDAHFPVLMSVRSGYEYFAIDRLSRAIVRGREPEYETTSVVCMSVPEMLELLAKSPVF